MTPPATFTLHGRLDGSNASDLEAQMLTLLAQGGSGLVIDLSRLDYLSSAGLRVLLRVSEAARARVLPIVLAAPQAPIARVLQISGFDRLIPIRDTLAEGLEAAGLHRD